MSVSARPPEFPEWSEDFRIRDRELEEAYETVSPQFRTTLKTGIAITGFRFSRETPVMRAEHIDARLGFRCHIYSQPVTWTAIIFPGSFRATARICAAATLPAACGVDLVFAVSISETPHKSALTALELCGVEDIFSLNIEQLYRLLKSLVKECPSGRALVPGAWEIPEVAKELLKLDLPCYEELRPPNILVRNRELFPEDLLAFVQGSHIQHDTNRPADAIYSLYDNNRVECGCPHTPLLISPGCEGFWLYPGLCPNFFRDSETGFGLI